LYYYYTVSHKKLQGVRKIILQKSEEGKSLIFMHIAQLEKFFLKFPYFFSYYLRKILSGEQ